MSKNPVHIYHYSCHMFTSHVPKVDGGEDLAELKASEDQFTRVKLRTSGTVLPCPSLPCPALPCPALPPLSSPLPSPLPPISTQCPRKLVQYSRRPVGCAPLLSSPPPPLPLPVAGAQEEGIKRFGACYAPTCRTNGRNMVQRGPPLSRIPPARRPPRD